jgi:O-antigen/teichoic acid export membrane protein
MHVLVSQVIGNAGYFVAMLLVARGLGPTGRGTVAFITVTALVTSQLANLGVTEATRVMTASASSPRPVLLANIALAAPASAAVAGSCIAALLDLVPGVQPAGTGGVVLVILIVATTAAASAAAGYAFLQGTSDFRPYARVQAGSAWVYAAALAVIQLTVGLTVNRAAVTWAGAMGLSGLMLLAAAARDTGVARPDLGLLRESVRFGIRAWIGSLSRLMNARTDQIITGLISTEATLGIYAVAVNSGELVYYLASATATALVPAVAASDPTFRVERTLRAYRALMLLTLTGIFVGAALGPVLLPLVFGHAYRPAVGPFLILLPSAIGFATQGLFSQAALASFAPGRSSVGPLVTLVTQTALDLVLIPTSGASGAAIAATVALIVGGAVSVSMYRSRFPFAWRALLPRLRDLAELRNLAQRLLRGAAVAPS